MRVVAEANKYLSDQAPWKLRESDPERMRTILHVALQAVSDCADTADAVPAALARTRCTRCSAAADELAPLPELLEVDDLDGGPSYPVLHR